jgi:hypothetical protein
MFASSLTLLFDFASTTKTVRVFRGSNFKMVQEHSIIRSISFGLRSV